MQRASKCCRRSAPGNLLISSFYFLSSSLLRMKYGTLSPSPVSISANTKVYPWHFLESFDEYQMCHVTLASGIWSYIFFSFLIRSSSGFYSCSLLLRALVEVAFWSAVQNVYTDNACTRVEILKNRWDTLTVHCPGLLWQKEASDKSDSSCKRAKCVCHFHWHQWNIMMSYPTYLSAGWVFMHKIWPGRRACTG